MLRREICIFSNINSGLTSTLGDHSIGAPLQALPPFIVILAGLLLLEYRIGTVGVWASKLHYYTDNTDTEIHLN